jgi:hypothetical protein
MNRLMTFLTAALAGTMVTACGGDVEQPAAAAEQGTNAETPVAVLTPEEKYSVTGKPLGPVRIDYRIIGTPVVGQPVTVDLTVKSSVGDVPVTLSYGTSDATAMSFPEAQQRTASLAFVEDDHSARQQVTVVPAREGRLFLNVTAHMQTDTGSLQTVTAVPIQVGTAPRELQQNGVVTTDENGELIREMPASDQ